MTLKTTKFDAAEHLDCPEAILGFLIDAHEGGDRAEFLHAVGIAARAEGMTEIARKLWGDEVERRAREIDEDTVKLVSSEEVERRIQARLS